MKKSVRFVLSMLSAMAAVCSCIGGCIEKDGGDGGGNGTLPGLYVEGGVMMKDGKPYYGMGINYFRLFNAYAEGDASTLHGLTQLARAGVPFVRFAAGPYWPVSWTNTYFKDRDAYFGKMDKLVELAEKLGIGLIPSVFWHMPTLADINGEHMDAFGDSRSGTIAFIRRYTAELVMRYKDSPAIWAWEFGNEFNLFVDIPHDSRPPNPVEMGCPPERDIVRDQFLNAHMINAFREFGAVVRQHDGHRAILSGNSEPRPSAWHNALYDPSQYWVADNYAQYREIIGLFECDPVNTVTVRGYCNYGAAASSYPLGLKTPSEYVAAMMKIAAELGKPLFVGEFGVSDYMLTGNPQDYPTEEALAQGFEERVAAIVENRVQLSALWVFDYPPQEDQCNITFENRRSHMIDRLLEAHAGLQRNIR